jgi:hypothetical protein
MKLLLRDMLKKKKKRKSLSSSTAVLDIDPMLPTFAFPALGADPFGWVLSTRLGWHMDIIGGYPIMAN